MDNTDLDALAVELVRAQKLLKDARHNVDMIEYELLKHLATNGVAEVRTEHYTLTEKVPPTTYQWKPEVESLLDTLVTKGDIMKDELSTVREIEVNVKVKTVQLLKLAKRRGFEKQLEDYYTKVARGGSHIEVKEVM